ncbi:MAG: DEAD/DEAH box helicase family protein [Candidatus Pacearchaeota archaeon]
MDTILVEKYDNVYFKLHCNIEQNMELKSFFSCYAPNYKYHPKFKAKIWNGKISFYNVKEQLLPIGLTYQLKEFLNRYDYKIKFLFDPNELINDISIDQINDFYEAIFRNTDFFPRDYQHQAIYTALKKKRGIIESPTASGKSLIIYSIIRFVLGVTEGKILLVVPSISLTTQMFNDFVEYGWFDAYDYSSILYSGSKKYDKNKRILISTYQSLHRKKENFFEDFDCVIIDETQQAKSNSIKTILQNCVNANYRFGLTGTLPTDVADINNIYGYIGPKIFSLKSNTLIDKGFLSKIKIVNMLIQYSEEEKKLNRKRTFPEESRAIAENTDRNKVIKYIVKNINNKDNTLILCEKIDHLKSIKEYVDENFSETHEIFMIYGNTNVDEREKIRKYMNENKSVILVASYGTMSTGVNISRIHHIIFASSYKSKIKVLQSIGRGLRKHKEKSKLILWDLIDDMTWVKRTGKIGKNYVYQHFEERLKYYKEQGFKYISKKINLNKL